MTATPLSNSPVSPCDDGPASLPLVLVVDDEKAQRDLLTAVLSSACRVDTAASVSEAVVKAELTPPALVIMDYAMPAASGIEGLQRLREIYPQLPVVILTGHADLEIARQAIQLGAVEYILKPFDPPDLLSVVLRLTTGATEQDEDSGRPLSEIPYALQRRLAANVDLWRSRLPTIPSENRLVAVLEPELPLEAKVLRLGRNTVQAEVYEPNATLESRPRRGKTPSLGRRGLCLRGPGDSKQRGLHGPSASASLPCPGTGPPPSPAAWRDEKTHQARKLMRLITRLEGRDKEMDPMV